MTSRLSLGLKFSIAVTALIILVMVGVASLIINYQKESLRQSAFESNLTAVRHLASDSPEPLLVFDPLRLDELVTTVNDATSCVFAMITDKNGRIVAHTKRAMLGTRLNRQDILKHLADGKELIKEHQYEKMNVIEFSIPVTIRNEILGMATIAFSTKKIDNAIEDRLGKLRKYIYMIAGIMLFAGIIGAFVVSGFLTKPLKRLKSKMLDVQTGNLDVEVDNPRLVKCWERLNCEKKDCPAYGKLRCWAIAGTFCHDKVQGRLAQKIGDCRKCVVYIDSCGDEINELVEVFNQMIKDLKHNLRELEKANSEKAKMERLSALGQVATTIAHETKNPLNAIKVATAYLKDNFHGAILNEFLNIIEEEVARLNDISSNFLDFSKPAPLNMKMHNINLAVEATVDLIRQEAADRNIEVIVLTGDLPLVQCDFSRIRQALLNLLINAMDASAEGGTIFVATESVSPEINIVVQDTGKGMGRGELENIFKPFYTTKTKGTGLGLAIVDQIVKEHGGEIEVESAVGKGTRFIIKLRVHEYARA